MVRRYMLDDIPRGADDVFGLGVTTGAAGATVGLGAFAAGAAVGVVATGAAEPPVAEPPAPGVAVGIAVGVAVVAGVLGFLVAVLLFHTGVPVSGSTASSWLVDTEPRYCAGGKTFCNLLPGTS